MPSFFSRKKNKDGPTAKISKSKKGQHTQDLPQLPVKSQWEDAWTRTSVEPEEVQELLQGCTLELKSRALDIPFLLLPFRPASDPSSARTFIRNYFDREQGMHGDVLLHELRLTEPMVLCSIVKWCWSRLAGGVVTWEAYELFREGESDSNMARDSFSTFIPLSIDSEARTQIIRDFFDLLCAIAAHGKMNGLGGRKLSRLAGWWAFELPDIKNGFDGGYQGWSAAADATSHLFFAYLRSLSPESGRGRSGISTLPMSLQMLLQETEYPPEKPSLMQYQTSKVAMVVDSVSPTPYALLRRTNHFQYRDQDRALQEFSGYEDPIQALTDECRRVLRAIASTNQSQALEGHSTRDATWSRFEDIGFSGNFDEGEDDEESNFKKRRAPQGLRNTPHTRTLDGGRPTTPSWADFLSSGFVDEAQNGPGPLLLPPDKILPPIETSRGRSSQSHRPRLESERNLEPGELASITRFDLDDAFWWVWMSSLAGEEPSERKAAFGRCALVETVIPGGRWLVLEEIVKGAASEPAPGAYVAEKKSLFGWTRRSKNSTRRGSTGKYDKDANGSLRPGYKTTQSEGVSKISIGPDQHARIQAAAAQLQQKQKDQEYQQQAVRRGRTDIDAASHKTSSVFTLQPVIMSEASPAMKWANKYDKDAIREAYLANNSTGRGLGTSTMRSNGLGYPDDTATNGSITPIPVHRAVSSDKRDLPKLPTAEVEKRPAVPTKASTTTIEKAPLPPTPSADPREISVSQWREQEHLKGSEPRMSEKASEVELPEEMHPIERRTTLAEALADTRISPQDTHPLERNATRAEEASLQSFDNGSRTASMDQQNYEMEKHRKLQKKAAGTGGFRSMFGRKNRNSVLPETLDKNGNGHAAPPQVHANQPQSGGGTLGRRFSGFRKNKKSVPVSADAPSPSFAASSASIAEDNDSITPVQSPDAGRIRSYAPSESTDISRVDTHDEREAKHAFSSFDQGPLEDVPAFVPDSPIDSNEEIEDAAMPPPDIRKGSAPAMPQGVAPSAPIAAQENGADSEREVAPMPVQDRWAQIRKNAAERAALRQSEEQGRGSPSVATDGDGETSGEETIESRVAKIKQRVAELTGNMETGGAPPPPNVIKSPVRRP